MVVRFVPAAMNPDAGGLGWFCRAPGGGSLRKGKQFPHSPVFRGLKFVSGNVKTAFGEDILPKAVLSGVPESVVVFGIFVLPFVHPVADAVAERQRIGGVVGQSILYIHPGNC